MIRVDIVPSVSAGCLAEGIRIGQCWPQQDYVTTVLKYIMLWRLQAELVALQSAGSIGRLDTSRLQQHDAAQAAAAAGRRTVPSHRVRRAAPGLKPLRTSSLSERSMPLGAADKVTGPQSVGAGLRSNSSLQ